MEFKIKLIFLLTILGFDIIHSNDILAEYDFVLLINKGSDYLMAKFNLDELKQCHFPGGPLRTNNTVVDKFLTISQNIYEDINSNSIKLQIFCIDDGATVYKSLDNEDVYLKKCGFEVPGQSKLHYVFCVKNEFKNISGHIILRNDLENLQKQNAKEEQIEDNENNDQTVSEQFSIDDIDKIEWELAAPELVINNLTFMEKVKNYCILAKAIMHIQYLKIKDYFDKSKNLENKDDSPINHDENK